MERRGLAPVHRHASSSPSIEPFEFSNLQYDPLQPTNFGEAMYEALNYVRDNPGAPAEDFFLLKRVFADLGRNDGCAYG